MIGIDRQTGQLLNDIEHLRQSVEDILTTPIGSRVMRRDYGSRLYQLVDAPLNSQTLVAIYAATAEALIRWEPRIHVTRVQAESISSGSVSLLIEGLFLPDQSHIQLNNIRV